MADPKEWPATKIVRKKVADLVPYARNARTHSPEHVEQIAAAIAKWGWTNPVLIDETGMIIAGHGRVMAAEHMGIDVVPALVARGWTDAEKRAYVIADNKLALNAGWDEDLLQLELSEIKALDFDLSLTGFSEIELDGILAGVGEGLTDPDDAPAAPDEPMSKPGDTWICGRHRVRCGDSTKAEDVAALLGDVKPLLMITDPPYGVEYDPDWRNRADRANGKPYGASAVGRVKNDERSDWREAWALFPGDVVYCWHAGRFAAEVQQSLEASGFEIRCQIIWAKPRFVISRGDYHWQHEPCWYAVRKGHKGHWSGDRSQTTLWEIEHIKSETGHGTQKPVECMRRPIVNNSSPGQAVYDPFLGSGTTLIAAEMTGRACYGMEIDPAYVDVIVKRWQEYTGAKATLERSKKTFESVTAERAPEPV